MPTGLQTRRGETASLKWLLLADDQAGTKSSAENKVKSDLSAEVYQCSGDGTMVMYSGGGVKPHGCDEKT